MSLCLFILVAGCYYKFIGRINLVCNELKSKWKKPVGNFSNRFVRRYLSSKDRYNF